MRFKLGLILMPALSISFIIMGIYAGEFYGVYLGYTVMIWLGYIHGALDQVTR